MTTHLLILRCHIKGHLTAVVVVAVTAGDGLFSHDEKK